MTPHGAGPLALERTTHTTLRSCHPLLAVAGALCLAACVVAASPAPASAGTFEIDACYPYTTTSSGVFQHAAVFGINTYLDCTSPAFGPGLTFADTPPAGIALRTGPNNVPAGTRAYWYTRAPNGLRIVAVTIPQFQMQSLNVNDGYGWGGGFFWDNGGAETHDDVFDFGSFMNSSTFGWQIVCGSSTCNGSVIGALLQIHQIHLFIDETAGPSITATSPLYGDPDWIRGNGWLLSFQTDDPSGVCQTQAVVGSTVFQGASSGQDHTVYHQCSVTSFSQTVNTTNYSNGPLAIALEARNAAGNWATPTSTVHVDNAPAQLSLSGPTDVPSTAGTQHITASATAGPSGVSGIHCTLDGAPYRSYPVSTVGIPVAGLGIHHLTCYGANNAKNPSGSVATSAPQSWTLRIAEPTAATIAFTRGGQRLRVPYGRGTTVTGTLATLTGRRLTGQPVTVYTAPDNGLQHFAPAETATTDANGAWSATIGAGPTRLVEAVYGGSATMERTVSAPIRLTVPAKLTLRVRPGHVRWATQVTITGRILGGFVPTDQKQASQLLKLRIGIVGVPGVHGDVGVPDLRPEGRFRTTFCLATGRGVVHYWFRAVTLYETNYPYERGSLSNRSRVTVGPRSAQHRACS